jgi:hypothetical protein
MSLSLGLGGRPLVVAPLAVVVWLLVGLLGSVPGAVAVGSCPNEAFRTGPSAALPDCRAYEMVSPPDKNGGEVDGGVDKSDIVSPEQAAASGEAVTYGSTSTFVEADPMSALVTSQYLSSRTAGGWQTREITPTQQLPEGHIELPGEAVPGFSLFQGFNEDVSAGFLLAWNPQPDPSAPEGYYNPYLFDGGTDSYQVLSEVQPPSWSPGPAELETRGFGSVYAGMSEDGQHVIFEANDALTPEAVPGRVNLYEWSAGRPLELVSVLPDGTVDTSGSPHLLRGLSMKFGSPIEGFQVELGHAPYNDSGALSSDGQRAFWSGGVTTGNQVYMHEITASGSRTVDVSASQKSGEPDTTANYWTANSEGSRVYFTSTGQLTADSTAGSSGPDLYQYEVNTGVLSDLSIDSNIGESADVEGVLGMGESEGVPYVYFVARGALAAGATAGANNVYVSRGGGAQPEFIATLGESPGEHADYVEAVMSRTSRVAPNGMLLAFQSARPLTGYDNLPADRQPCPAPVREGNENLYNKLTPEGRCMEVFEYDAQTRRLVCASCDPTGLPPTGDSLVPETPHYLENIRGWESSTVQQRYLLDDGRLFFQSEDALLPQATDDKQNVYEYEPGGIGQCAASGAGGCLYLISTGEGGGNSYFADASADGRDVFFLTNEQLVAQDGDGAIDMYDAREDGGFSSAQLPPCSGEACKPAVTPAPAIYGAPSSATFQGAGDISASSTSGPSTVKQATKKAPAKGKKKVKRKAKSKKPRGKARRSERRSERGGR